jgi:hypothetical protein
MPFWLSLPTTGERFVVICTEGEEMNYFLLYFIDSDKTLLRPNPCEEALGGGVGVCSSIKTMALEGKRLHHGGDVCVLVFS